jgi:hypothetical protein
VTRSPPIRFARASHSLSADPHPALQLCPQTGARHRLRSSLSHSGRRKRHDHAKGIGDALYRKSGGYGDRRDRAPINTVGANGGQASTPKWIYRANLIYSTPTFSARSPAAASVRANIWRTPSNARPLARRRPASSRPMTITTSRGLFYVDLNLTQKIAVSATRRPSFFNVTNLFDRRSAAAARNRPRREQHLFGSAGPQLPRRRPLQDEVRGVGAGAMRLRRLAANSRGCAPRLRRCGGCCRSTSWRDRYRNSQRRAAAR